jgi:hypothetical protein
MRQRPREISSPFYSKCSPQAVLAIIKNMQSRRDEMDTEAGWCIREIPSSRPELNLEVGAGQVLDDEGNAIRFALVRSEGFGVDPEIETGE